MAQYETDVTTDIKCPDCGKRLLQLMSNGTTTLKVWCKKCKEEKIIIIK